MIKMEELSCGYGNKIILDNISVHIHKGEIVTLIGPNGSGKSTLLKTLIGSLEALKGSVSFVGKSSLDYKEVSKVLSCVMTGKLRPEMKVQEVVESSRYPYTGLLGLLKEEDNRAVYKALSMVDLLSLKDMDFNKLSDGQKQRCMIARAIAQETDIIVLDEPTSFLDMHHKIELLKIIQDLCNKEHKTIFMSLHELDLVRMISHKVMCVKDSHLVRYGTVDEVFKNGFIQKLYGIDLEEFDEATGAMRLIDTWDEKACKDSSKMASSTKDEMSIGACDVPKPSLKFSKDYGKDHKAHVIMVQGTMSSSGKSLLVASLCRIFKEDGYKVAPFKSQNMALNSYITEDGYEMGRAQVMQAECAGLKPSVLMNPILLKPTSDVGSQVIVNGVSRGNMKAKEYFQYKTSLIPDIKEAFLKLEEDVDIIVIEGAGSPAEINLKDNDIVNMGLARLVDAPVLLVSDIDRGGVFAQLVGTIELLEKEERERVKGLIINKFRGDGSILDPGIKMVEERLKLPVTGVLPYLNIKIDDEDSLTDRFSKEDRGCVTIGVIKLPHISNFSDFTVFDTIEGVRVIYIKDPHLIEDCDLLFIPGSKNTLYDLKWLKEQGFAPLIERFSKNHIVFGLCGGYQILGKSISDPEGVEEGGSACGLNLLDVETVLKPEKTRKQVTGSLSFGGVLSFLNGRSFKGYEIHMGETSGKDEMITKGHYKGNVYGSYVHGLFDDEAYELCSYLASCKSLKLGEKISYEDFKEAEYNKLSKAFREHLNMETIYSSLSISKI